MSPEFSALTDGQKRVSFPELETEQLSDFNIFELIPDGQFTSEQVKKIKIFSEECDNGLTIYHDNIHIIFSFPDEVRLFLCLGNSEENYHRNMWYRLKEEFGENLVLRDAGRYFIYEGEHIIDAYVSEGLSVEKQEIIPEQCFACREEISNMNIGITVRGR